MLKNIIKRGRILFALLFCVFLVGGIIILAKRFLDPLYIQIDNAQCIADGIQHKTGLWVTGHSNIPTSELVASTELMPPTGSETGLLSPNDPTKADGYFRFNPLLGNHLNIELCPRTITIASRDGSVVTKHDVKPLMTAFDDSR